MNKYKEYNFINMFFVYFIFSAICHLIRTIYEILKYKKILKDDNNIFFILIVLNMVILLTSWMKMSKYDPIKIIENYRINFFGFLLFLFGLILFVLSVFHMKGFKDDDTLVISGLYSKIRHPMYYGVICWEIGFCIYKGGAISLFISFIFGLNIILWKNIEETILENRFLGYRKYLMESWF